MRWDVVGSRNTSMFLSARIAAISGSRTQAGQGCPCFSLTATACIGKSAATNQKPAAPRLHVQSTTLYLGLSPYLDKIEIYLSQTTLPQLVLVGS